MKITEATTKEVNRILEEQGFKPEEKIYLRIRATGGGCSGMQFKLDLDDVVNAIDETFVVNGINVVVDNRSILYTDDIVIDFINTEDKHGFSVINPLKTTCGCASAISIAQP